MKYICPKCSGKNYELGEIHVAGSTIAKIFDIEGTKFSTITCRHCAYTEFYKCSKEELGNILDFLVGN